MTNPDDLLRAIIADPANDDLRMVYADLLDDRGEGERSEFVRLQIELANCSLDEDSAKRMASFSHNPNSVRYALEIAKKRRREWELLHNHSLKWLQGIPFQCIEFKGEGPIPSVACGLASRQSLDSEFYFKRGFVYKVRCTYEDWARHADAITARCPIERVVLTTWPQSYGTFLNNNYKLIGVNNSAAVAHEEAFPASMQWQDLAAELLKRTWPRITFTLPAEVAV